MKLYAISDLHLSHGKKKEMDIFGEKWRNHWDKIAQDWRERVQPEDAVLVAGDISWAMTYQDFAPDLAAIQAMPGQKLFIKGNHDFWHSSLAQTRRLMGESCHFIQNDSLELEQVVVAGARGWKHPGDGDATPEDEKIYRRELIRARLSLESAKKSAKEIVFMSHFPPFQGNRQPTELTKMLEEFGVGRAIFGHIHGRWANRAVFDDFAMNGTVYMLTSCDYLDFRLKAL